MTTVDFYQPLIDEFERQFRAPHLRCVKNNGTDLPTVDDGSIDYLWTFGTFVHLEPKLIRGYLASIPRILAPNANVVIHYSDKRKPRAQQNPAFTDNDPELIASGWKKPVSQLLPRTRNR